MEISRHKTKAIKIGSVKIGGRNSIAIQSMVKADGKNISAVISQIRQLEKAGCDIVRIAVKDKKAACAIGRIKKCMRIPLVADIHFDYKLALLAIENGIDKIRLNPGNIYKPGEVRQVAVAARDARIPIRVGVNSGSLRRTKASGLSAKNPIVRSALSYIKMLEGFGFYDIVVSLKTSSVLETVQAYREFSKKSDYPLHLGLTATGSVQSGIVKSSIALGLLLSEGIGDTIRVSLTSDPQEEVKVARSILQSLGLRKFGPEIISCPTCGRCEVNLIRIVKELENRLPALCNDSLRKRKKSNANLRPVKVAIMGCVVNGPGEAKEADLGIAFGKDQGLLFKKGLPIKKIKESQAINIILRELNKL